MAGGAVELGDVDSRAAKRRRHPMDLWPAPRPRPGTPRRRPRRREGRADPL